MRRPQAADAGGKAHARARFVKATAGREGPPGDAPPNRKLHPSPRAAVGGWRGPKVRAGWGPARGKLSPPPGSTLRVEPPSPPLRGGRESARAGRAIMCPRHNGEDFQTRRPHPARVLCMEPTTAGEAVVASLIAHGLDTVYALPGLHNDPLFDALFQASERIRTVHTRHEQGAAYMALGAALGTGKPQAYSVVPGPGLLNSGAALLTAYGMNAPVLALIGQIPDADIGRGFGHLHEIRDQAGIIARLVGHCACIRGPEEASALVAQAMSAMRTGRPGPAALECAIDVWGRAGEVKLVPPQPAPEPLIDEDAGRDAAEP